MNRHQQDNQGNYKPAGHKAQIANKNASSFDILSFNPDSRGNLKDQERFEKKQKQAAYRDQLDNMVANKTGQQVTQKVTYEDYPPSGYREQEYGNRNAEQRYVDQNQRGLDEDTSAQDKKKRMQQEINEANRRAAESKAQEKRRQKANEMAEDYQRAQDSLSQYEREGFRQKEAKKVMNEENTRVLEQQLRDFHIRKQGDGQPSYDSVDKLNYQQGDYESRGPLAPSSSKINQNQGQCPFARDDDHSGSQKQNQYVSHQQSQNRYQEPQSRSNVDSGSQYQKNKNRAQYSSYNIINHEA